MANCSVPVSQPPLPAIAPEALRLSQSICDVRFARCAATTEIDVVSIAVLDASRAADKASAARDPAVLTIAFSTAATPAQRFNALIELDLDEYPALRIALGTENTNPAATAANAVATKRRQALTLSVAELLIESLLTRLSALHFDNLRLIGIARGRIAQMSGGSLVHLVLSPRDANAAIGGSRVYYEHTVSLPDCAVDCIDALVQDAPVDLQFGELTVPGSLVIGTKRLSVDTLARLQPGDVLLRALFPSFDARLLFSTNEALGDDEDDALSSDTAGSALAAWGTTGLVRLCAIARFDAISAVITKETYMSDHLDPAFIDAGLSADQQGDSARIGDLELPVQFEIDTLAIPLSQLSAIGPGYVIEFPVPFRDAKLRLVAHGSTIGHGELVTVGDHLGVRIVRMAHNDNTLPRADDGSI
ncbi:type III secretion system cytoplasmic ring protein SctQ [Trinickia acidisoli]|uniref:type III secretion system cytoplasmic ring protein SctQ n=1 Tax=Trinickia acidisoli TaxID=2767482 RepID=UPI001A8DBE5E|nr:type III secretion system cytoplasmic ring protein SctQ [Trinickia acidisoli]